MRHMDAIATPKSAADKCKYCEHGNPPDSKYCNACGAILTLAPCPHCGAVSEVTATTCYQCRGSLQGSGKDALVPALPAAANSLPSRRQPSSHRRQPSLAIVGTVVVGIVAFIGYYAYRHYSLVSLPPSSAASTEEKGRSRPIQPESTPGPAATPTVPVTAVPVARPQTADGGKAGELAPPRLGPCTERVAALGLCTPKAVSKDKAEAAAAVPAAVARPQSNNGGEPCTERVAALGLCTPESK
jgi:hypothetical protein